MASCAASGSSEAFADAVEIVVRGVGREPHRHAEQLGESLVEPEPRRGPAEQVVALREGAPDLARIGLDRAAVLARNAHVLQRHVLAVKHAENVVVGRDEQPCRIGEGRILGIPARIGMAVRRDDRQVAHLGVKAARDRARREIHREQPVGVDQRRGERGGSLRLHLALRALISCDLAIS